jgi:hypothetical protein
MTPELFWELIDATRPASHDPAGHVRALHERLVRLAPRQIVAFDKLLRELLARAFHWDGWALAFLAMERCGEVYPAVRAKGRRTPAGTAWREETLETSHDELAAAVRRGRATTLLMKQEPPQS